MEVQDNLEPLEVELTIPRQTLFDLVSAASVGFGDGTTADIYLGRKRAEDLSRLLDELRAVFDKTPNEED